MARRSPLQYDFLKLQFDQTILTKHFTTPRRRKIKYVVVHHMTILGKGNGSALDTCYKTWQSREASAHYGVDGSHIRQFVWDGNAAWSLGNSNANHESISIEHANQTSAPNWEVSETTWKNGAKLAAYIHAAYKLGRPTSNSNGSKGTLRVHRSFTSTACPGPFMMKIWSKYVAEAQRVYDNISNKPSKPNTARWYKHKHLNTKGDDSTGAQTFDDRFYSMLNSLMSGGKPEVITLNEVATAHQKTKWTNSLIDEGYKVAYSGGGNLVAVIASSEIGYAGTYVLNVQGAGREEELARVRAKINGYWAHIGCSHLDYRDGPKFDTIRVNQAKSIIKAMQRFAINPKYLLPTWKTRTSIGIDENSVSWVRDKAFLPAGFKPAIKDEIDAIYSARPAISNKSTETLSDHPIVEVTYGRKVN